MSGRSEARLLIHDSRQAQRLAVARRLERLFAVEVALVPVIAPSGSQQEHETDRDAGCWVNLSGASSETTEKAKDYILSLCVPAVVKKCPTDQQLVQQLLSETSKLRDDLETEFCTAILPGPSPSCISIQGTSELSVVGTVERIQAVMAPPDLPQPQPSSSSSLLVVTPDQSRPTPTSTAGTFSPSPPPPSTEADLRERVTPHQFPNIPTPTVAPPSTRHLPGTEREKIVQRIAYEIEQQKDGDVVSRGVDSSHREQTIHYFLRLNFPQERIETVVDSMGPWADTDDILKRLNSLHVTSPRPVAILSSSRNYTTDGEPVLNSNVALRPVVIDGSNVAMRHGNGRVFSCRGIQIAVDWFHQQGHKEITVFVPQWRRETPRAEYPITDQEILNQLEREGILKFTPSRRIGNKKIVCYDDRFIVRLASETNGVIVSNDNFRDLAEENEKWRKTIENRLVMFTFAHDIFMVPEDPLGKYGPRLSQLLQIEPAKSSSKSGAQQDHTGPSVCPYGERCTFGRRCRFAHPEREGRLDPTSLLTSRSPTTSPAPTEKRHTDALGDIQKDGTSSHSSSERGSPSGPMGQPTTSPQRPRTSPAHTEINYTQQPSVQPVPHGYSQPQPSSGYPSQPLSSENHHYSHSQPHLFQPPPPTPQYLGIPAAHGGSLSPPPPPHSSGLQLSPLHSNPSTPLAGGVSAYPSRTFPMANLSLVHSRNVTDRIQRSPIANGGDDLVPTAPSVRPIVPPSHGVMDSQPRLVPRGGQSAQFQGPPHNPSYNWSSVNGAYHHHPAAYHMPHAQNSYHPPSHHYVSSGDQLHHQHMAHHSLARNPHTGDYSTVPHGGHLPQPTNSYQNFPSSAVENGVYHQQEHAAMLHQQGAHQDYRYPHHRAVEPRAASMYGDMGLRLHHEKVALADKFQTSQSSPELYCDNRSLRTQAKPSVSGGINWTLFRQVQSHLPNQEEQIMSTMLQHPQADLDQLVELIQRSW